MSMVGRHGQLVGRLLLVGCLVTCVGGVSIAAGATPAITETGRTQTQSGGGMIPTQLAPDTDNTVTRIVVHPNGTATWTLQIRTRLETDQESEEYRAFQQQFRSNTSRYLDPFRESLQGIVEGANNVTGRDMRAEGFRASTTIQTVPRRWGVVTYRFEWVRFAAVDGERLVVGDVFEGGLFIAENDSLSIRGPPGYAIVTVDPQPDEREDVTVTWTGREDFADRRPHVVFEPSGSGGIVFLQDPLLGGIVLLGIAVLGVIGYWRWARPGSEEAGEQSGSADARHGGGSGDPDLLTDEDRVHRLLDANGGRLRQADIVEELEWSKSKTSRVLSKMEDGGTIEKLQLGRENVIDLVDENEE